MCVCVVLIITTASVFKTNSNGKALEMSLYTFIFYNELEKLWDFLMDLILNYRNQLYTPIRLRMYSVVLLVIPKERNNRTRRGVNGKC